MTYEEALSFLKTQSPLRITLSGEIGSGKSTFAKHLAEVLEVPRVYIGQFMREEAAKRNMTLDEFNTLLEQDDAIDRSMDDLQKTKAQETERGVFEGRTSWYFVEQPDVKVFFTVDPNIAAERIWNDDNALRDRFPTVEALKASNEQRRASEQKRYEGYYNIDAYDPAHFDVILDTSTIGIKEVFETGVIKIAEFLSNKQ